jgi:hypothetical protein
MQLYNIIRSAGGGEIVKNLAAGSGLEPGEVEEALRALLPEIGSAIRRAGESRSGAAAAHALMRDERYRRYFENPSALAEPAASADGERVLNEILDQGERGELVRRVAAAIGPDEGQVRALLPRVAVLAAAALGERLREPPPAPASSESAGIPWFGSRQDDHFAAPLLNALASLFEAEEEHPPKRR